MSLRRTSSSAHGGTLVDLGTAWSETKRHQSFEFVLNIRVGEKNLVLTTHQKSRGAVQETSDSGDKTSVEKAGDLRRNFSCLWRVKHAAHHKVLT